jgi:hypothetical protein
MRRLAASLLVAGCVLGLSACGGGGSGGSQADGSEPVAVDLYTGSVCSALRTWRQHLESASAILVQRTNAAKTLQDVKTQFVSFFDGAAGETDTMLDEVAAAGIPDVNDGEGVARSMLMELRRFRQIVLTAKTKAEQLPLANEQVFTKQTQTMGTAFQFEITKLPTLFDELGRQHEAPELASAAKADPLCRSL